MADKKIEDATPDTQVTGVEKLPVSDAGVAKCLTVGQVKNYTLAQIAAIATASGIDLTADGVYLLKDGELKPVASNTLASAVLDYGFGKVAVASMNGNEVVGVKDATAQKTITVSQLKTWLEANMTVSTNVDIVAKDAAGNLGASDLLLVAQSGTNKKMTLTTLTSYVHAAFRAYVEGLTSIPGTDSIQDSDVFYIIHSSTGSGTQARKATIAQLRALFASNGDVIAPTLAQGETWASAAEGNVPKWDETSKTLTKGIKVHTQLHPLNPVGSQTGRSSTDLLSESAIGLELDKKVDVVPGKGLSTNDYTTVEKEKLASLSDSEMTGASSGADGAKGLVPKPIAGDQASFLRGDGTWAEIAGDVAGPSSTTENNVPQWDETEKKLKNGRGLIDEWPTGEGHPNDADRAKIATFALIESESDYNKETYLEIPFDVTDGNIPVFSVEEAEEEGGLDEVKIVDGPAIATKDTTPPSGADLDTYVPTVKRVENDITQLSMRIGEVVVFTEQTPTAGKIPKWATPASGEEQEKELVDGYAVNATVGASPSDNNLLTEKAVTDHVASFFSSSLSHVVESASTPTIGQMLLDRHHYTFNVQTGQTHTLALPTSNTGKARDFRVAFNQTKSGESTTTTVTFTGTGTIISKEGGASNTISLSYDTETTGTEYHVLHFFDMADNLVCVKEV